MIASVSFYTNVLGPKHYFHTIDLGFVSDHPISKYRLRPQIIKKNRVWNFRNKQKVGLLYVRRGTHRVFELRQFWHLTSAKFCVPPVIL